MGEVFIMIRITLLAAAAMVPLAASAQPRPPTEPVQPLEYAVRFLCGTNGPPATTITASIPPGNYFTTISVHNPGPRQRISQKVTLSVPAPATLTPPAEGNMTDIATNVMLEYDGAIEFDCQWIMRRIAIAGLTPRRPTSGFLVLQSRGELDVVAVYMAAQAPARPVVSVQTERVPVRRVQ
jgi:hypothetical protein